MVHTKNPAKLRSNNIVSSTPVSLLSENQLSDASENISLSLPVLSEDVLKTSDIPLATCSSSNNHVCCDVINGPSNGVETEMPAQLAKLYTANTPEAIEFGQCIRSYNNMFAFTSLGVHSDKELNKRDRESMHSDLRGFEDIYNHKIFLNSHPSLDQRVYNTPTISQVATIWTENDLNIGDSSQHIQVYPRSGRPQIIKDYFGYYDTLQYPLIFARGETGWHEGIQRIFKDQQSVQDSLTCQGHDIHIGHCSSAEEIISAENAVLQKRKKKRNTVCREYYCYKFQMCQIDKSLLLHCGRLFQQFCIDTYVKIESARLDFHRNRQRQIRTDVYQGILDSIANGETSASNVSKRIYLPASFIGGPRDMKRIYMDAMTLVQKYGKPDIFLTMTCNPAWPEIKKHLSNGEEAHNRPDVTLRVFRAKLEMLRNDIIKKGLFGKVATYTYVIEFQKRGLPHAHFLIILANGCKLDSPEAYDRVISAELPDPASFPYLHSIVVAHMLHGPCGTTNKNSPCMKQNRKCRFAYPKEFAEFTRHNKDSYPLYMRRHNGNTVTAHHFQFDNRWVVSYNPYLLAKYDCHINVEVCSTIEAVKYIYKYIYKGHSKILYQLNEVENDGAIDEIKNFQSGRWICAPEATWRVFAFDLSNLNPSVMALQIHLEGEQSMVFNEDDILERVAVDERMSRTMLTEFFWMNSVDARAQALKCLYKEFPQHFVWNATHRIWEPRQRRSTIGRLTTVHPTQGEKYYLRMLLRHVKGPMSYESLKHIGSRTASTFREAAEILGLLKTDDSAEQCLLEVKFEPYLSKDISRDKSLSPEQTKLKVLQLIDSHLQYMGKHLADFNIAVLDTNAFSIQRDTQEIEAELDIKVSAEDIALVALLNDHQ
nr:uncharacterized protein LOC113729090 [Coffea arabica]